jgi:hypothetical protein
MHLNLDDAPVAEPAAAPAPAVSASTVFAPVAVAVSDPPPSPPSPPATSTAQPPAPSPAAVVPNGPSERSEFRFSMTPLSITPAYGEDVTPSVVAPVDVGIPPIREATPVPSFGSELPHVAATTTVPTVDAAAPVVPGTQPEPMPFVPTLQPAQQARPAPIVSPLAVSVPQRTKSPQRKVHRSFRLIIVLLVIGGLVAAAVIFGRPYLFPNKWDGNAQQYGDQVEEVTGASFAEPVKVTSEPTAAYNLRSTKQLTGDWQSQLAGWRALGLADGDVTTAGLVSLLADQPRAMYSTDDGQIYGDNAVSTVAFDANATRAMAIASLDQRYGWAIGQSSRTLDEAALVSAQVLAQASAIQTASQYSTPIAESPTGPLAYLPKVLSYQTLAPAMYAQLLGTVDPKATTPLADLTDGIGPIQDQLPPLASAAVIAPGDTVSVAALEKDRSYWYLVFAGYLDSNTAYAASEAIIDSSLTTVQRSGTTCVYSTFSGGDVTATATLRAALESMVAAMPAEMTPTFSVNPDGGLQVVSCDPGAQAATKSRLGVARALVGWRSAKIATVVGVRQLGGNDAAVAAALTRLAESNVGAELASAPLDDSPTKAADAVRAAVAPIVSPPAPPAVQPAG